MKYLITLLILFYSTIGFASVPGYGAQSTSYKPNTGGGIGYLNDAAESNADSRTIELLHRGGVSTTYELPAGFVQSEYVTFEIEPGAMMTWASGVTPSFIPDQIKALPSQQIWDGGGGLGMVEAGVIPLDWNGILPNIETEAQATINLDAVNQLIDAVTGVTGCVLSLGAGSEYWFEADDRINFWARSNMHFKGAGPESSGFNWIEFNPAGGNMYGLITNRKAPGGAYDHVYVENVSFEDMYLDNSGVTPNNISGSGGWGSRGTTFRVNASVATTGFDAPIMTKNIRIENTIWKSWSLPHSIYQAENVTIVNNRCINGDGVLGTPSITVMNNSNNVVITGNIVEDILWESGTQSAINVQANNMTISNNAVGGNWYGGGILLEGGYNIVVDGNICDFRNCDYTDINGIGIQGTDGSGLTNLMITNNLLIANPDIQASTTSRGILISKNTHDITIDGNTIKNFGKGINIGTEVAGVYITGVIDIDHNKIINSKYNPFVLNLDSANPDFTDTEVHFTNNVISGATPYCQIGMIADGGPVFVTGNTGGEINLINLSEDHRTHLSGNIGPEGVATYSYYGYQNLSDAERAMISWDDATYSVSDELDLSGADTEYFMLDLDPAEAYWIPKIDILYTEATSADAGVNINIKRWGTSGVLGFLPSYTTTVSTPIRTVDTHYLTTNQAYVTDQWYGTRCVGGKTGTGAVRVIYTVIKQ